MFFFCSPIVICIFLFEPIDHTVATVSTKDFFLYMYNFLSTLVITE